MIKFIDFPYAVNYNKLNYVRMEVNILITGLYFFTFVVSIMVLLSLLIFHKRTITMPVLFSLLISVNSLGRFLICVANTMEMAILGNLMIYLGACFCPLMVVRLLIMLCHFESPKWLTYPLTFLSTVCYAITFTSGHNGLYYKSLTLVTEGSYHYLLKEYGPLHICYPILLLIYAVIIGLIVGKAIKRHREFSIRTVASLTILAVVILASYLIEKIVDTHVSYVTVGYLMALFLFIHMIDRINMFDLPTNIANSVDQQNENGYIEFDGRYRLAGYNDRVRTLFPEVETKWKIDKKIPQDDSFLYKEVILWMFTRKTDKKIISLGDRFYELRVRPIHYEQRACVGYMLEIMDRTAENKYLQTMENFNDKLQTEVELKTRDIAQLKDNMVVAMATMVESRDNSTGDHIKRTYQVMKIFSRHLIRYKEELGITEKFLEMACRAAPMHDLGKIAVDDAVLKKKGRFTDEEYEKMKMHPGEGAKIVRGILTGTENPEFVEIAVNVAHYHHEKWNGQGYPTGISGENIPLEARLMALADVFDALVSKRCYKEAYSYDRAFNIIEDSLGTHFDPVLGRYFMECRPALEEMYRKWDEEDGDEKALQLEKS